MRAGASVSLLMTGLLLAAVSPAEDAGGHERAAPFPEGAAPVQAAAGGDGPAADATAEPPLVEALRARGARVMALGERGGLDGHFVELADGDAYGLYLTPDGHAVAGLLYAPDGTLITGGQIAAARSVAGDRTIPASHEAGSAGYRDAPETEASRHAHLYGGQAAMPHAEALFERSASAFGFTLGRSGPLAVLFADPGCRWSRSAVVRLGHVALDGRLRLRVVPVGVLGVASAREAAAIASAPDPALAWFEGTRAPARPEGGRRIEDNNALYDRWGARAVPLTVWRARDGRIAQRLGDVDDVEGWLEALRHE